VDQGNSGNERTINGRAAIVIAVIAGIAANVIPNFLATFFDLPLYLDTVGTISAAILAGLFPGILIAVITCVICGVYNNYSIYFTLIGALVALSTYALTKNDGLKKKTGVIRLILILSLIGGVLGTLVQWMLLGRVQFDAVAESTESLVRLTGIGHVPSSVVVSIGLNLVDKGICAGIAFAVCHFMPERIKKALLKGGWRQKPLTNEEFRDLLYRTRGKKTSMQKKISVMLSIVVLSLTGILCVISLNLYFENVKKEYTKNARSAAFFASSVVDADMVERYLREGRKAPGYDETESLLYKIRDNSQGVEFLYIVKIKQDGCHFVFDLNSEDTEAYSPGEVIEFEEAFIPYLPDLYEGKAIPPIESNDAFGWLLTAYTPIRDGNGKTVAYAAADVSMKYLSGFAFDFITKIVLIFSGFFITILVYGIWFTRYSFVYPVGSMTAVTKGFISQKDDQKTLDKKTGKLTSLDIHTGDEIEELYESISRMATGIDEQIRELRYYASSTAQMQNGLIMTMADMVENRDSDTGAHIQKTAAYVRIILEGLKKKGYYHEKLSSKYISDVVMSAPLHDVGKINIPDAILNKPGKLTDEEYEIMKTHTTAGKQIIENAINKVQGENYLKEARNMAAYHHERWDGKGYPEGLREEVIPLSARVMAVADVFDALASPRIYKPAFPFEKAIGIIEEGSGTQFDPKCVEVFLESLDEVKAVLKKYHEG